MKFFLYFTCRETYENERTKLIQQAQQLSVDLEQARENLALKSRDNLKLQEEVKFKNYGKASVRYLKRQVVSLLRERVAPDSTNVDTLSVHCSCVLACSL